MHSKLLFSSNSFDLDYSFLFLQRSNSRPKKDNLTALDEYRKAETIGEEQGDCWSFYPQCPFSIFNIIPDVYTKDDQVI